MQESFESKGYPAQSEGYDEQRIAGCELVSGVELHKERSLTSMSISCVHGCGVGQSFLIYRQCEIDTYICSHGKKMSQDQKGSEAVWMCGAKQCRDVFWIDRAHRFLVSRAVPCCGSLRDATLPLWCARRETPPCGSASLVAVRTGCVKRQRQLPIPLCQAI